MVREKGFHRQRSEAFFTISTQFIPLGRPVPYDLYINSSSLPDRKRFVRVLARNQIINEHDLRKFRNKYRHLYVSEAHRPLYFRSLAALDEKSEQEKATVLKDSAIEFLGALFKQRASFSAQAVTQAISGCHDVVEGFVDMLGGARVENLQGLIAKLSLHDFYTYDHSINVAMYSILIHRSYDKGVSREELVLTGLGGLLHDLGKIKIPTHIINKTTKLSSDEFKEIQRHPGLGRDLLSERRVKLPGGVDRDALKCMIHQHHENFDGTGYPDQASGEGIDIRARIISVADFFDAITTKRSYHEALPVPEALTLMATSCGKKLDPAIFKVLAENVAEFEKAKASEFRVVPDFDPCQPRSQPVWKKVKVKEGEPASPEDIGWVILVDE